MREGRVHSFSIKREGLMFSCNIYYARGTGAQLKREGLMFSIQRDERGSCSVVIYIMREGRVHSFSIKREGLMFSCNIYYARGTGAQF